MKFSNTYIKLDNIFYQNIEPEKVTRPAMLLWNDTLADNLQLQADITRDPEQLAQYFAGNQLPPGAEPIALAYAGHQFGHFNPQLGDGRAHLLGEIIDADNIRRDIQLKGSGPTRFSRGGDGRCALKPAVREYIMSEAMYALGVPTTRCLAVVTSGEYVYRDSASMGAIVTRVASSHLRVGTFQYFAARGDFDSLKALTDYAIKRHCPEIDSNSENSPLDFLESVINNQIRLVVEWMRVGFIHGVMNTDNTAVSGETIDYGPCAMLGSYDPATVFSSIDAQGRYAFGNQGAIAQWNMARLAECLLPLIDSDVNKAIESVEPLIQQMSQNFEQAYLKMMSCKLGITNFDASDTALIHDLLDRMQKHRMDYTQTFEKLTHALANNELSNELKTELGNWLDAWQTRLVGNNYNVEVALQIMQKHNPLVIPRNHHLEAVLTECEQSGDAEAAEAFLQVLRSPYTQLAETGYYQTLPQENDSGYKTFCGT